MEKRVEISPPEVLLRGQNSPDKNSSADLEKSLVGPDNLVVEVDGSFLLSHNNEYFRQHETITRKSHIEIMKQPTNVHLLLLVLGFVNCAFEVSALATPLSPSRNMLAHGLLAPALKLLGRTTAAVPTLLCLAATNDKNQYDNDNPSASLLLDSAREESSSLRRQDLGDDSSDTTTPSSLGDAVQRFVDKFLAAGGGTAPIGTRGEAYFFVQAALVVAIVFGGLPGVSPVLGFLAGPGLLILGLVVLIITALNLGPSITPWPTPNGQGLVQDGPYGVVRHPMYLGLVATMTGFSVTTHSNPRLLLTGLLILVMDVKSDFEEEELKKAYPGEYEEYQTNVTDKFVPIRGFWKSKRNGKPEESSIGH